MTTTNRQQCNWQNPLVVAKKLIQEWGKYGLIWLDGDGTKLGRWITMAIDPIDHICCRGRPEEPGALNPFEALRNLEPGHWTGWLSYEAGAWIEPTNPWKADNMATLWIARHDPVLRFDLKKRELWIEGVDPQRFQSLQTWLQKSITKNTLINSNQIKEDIKIPIETWKWLTSKKDYIYQVEQVKSWIASGDIFQANLSACCTTALPDNSCLVDIFGQIRNNCASPFGGMIIASGSAQGEALISTSPERFLKVLSTGVVESRPIKGTRPRQKTIKDDLDMAIELICSAKDRAENVMIVDLLRNDLGKVCTPGSIQVPQLVGLESFSHVHHLTSIIRGSLRSTQTWVDLLQACWPGGSISGAPKLRACQRLHDLEPTARGPYCGSMLHVDWNGNFDSNILIRSILVKNSTLRVHAGCGIVAESDPLTEANELDWKLIPLLKSLT